MPGNEIQLRNTIRILLVDGHMLFRSGLRMLIESHPGMQIAGEASNATVAVKIAAEVQPDIVLLEPNPAEDETLDCIQGLLAACDKTRVILVTGITDIRLHQQAVALGAMGIVLKAQSATVLIRAIEKVYAGEVWLSHTLMAGVLKELARGRSIGNEDSETNKISFLSQREREVIRLIGQGLKNKQIAETMSISEITVRHHLTSIFAKLGISDRLELIIYAYQHGLAKLPL